MQLDKNILYFINVETEIKYLPNKDGTFTHHAYMNSSHAIKYNLHQLQEKAWVPYYNRLILSHDNSECDENVSLFCD